MARTSKTKPKTNIVASTWKLAIYIRLSKEDAEEDESLSVTNQKKILTEYVHQYFTEPFNIIDFYVDDGLTGTDQDRPAFQRMIKDIEQNRVNCVVCKTLSRAFRNYSDQGLYLESFFPKHHIRFISVGSPHVDSYENPEGISGFEVPITGLMNDRFAARTSEDIRRTFDMKRRKGEFIGGFASYGYQKDPKNKNHLVIDVEAASVVHDIFDWFVNEGLSQMGITKRLNERGIPNPTLDKRMKGITYQNPNSHINDGLWNSSTVRNILTNKMYLGHMVQGRYKIISYKVHDQIKVPEDQWYIKENMHEPIVEQLLFDKAQDLLRRDTRTANGSKKLSLFAGFIRCADCKKALQRKTSKGRVYYVCRTNREKSNMKCSPHSIRVEVLEQVVFAAIKAQVLLVEQLAEAVEKIKNSPVGKTKTSKLEGLLASRQTEQDKIRKAIANLYMDLKSDLISTDDYLYMKKRFDDQQEQIKQAVEVLEEEMRVLQSGEMSMTPLFAHFLANKTLASLDRGLLTAMIDVVLVHENKEVEIRFKYDDQFRYLVEYVLENNEVLSGES